MILMKSITNPNWTIVSMVILLLTQGYLLISPFVYSGAIAIFFFPTLSKSSAGEYAGFIASSFMAGRMVSAYPWGKFSDRYGRKKVLLITMGASAILSFIIGFMTNFYAFVFVRFFLGFFNCVPGTLKTVISEAAKGNREWESNTMGFVFGFWGVSFLFAPLVSGALSDPVAQYPDSLFYQDEGFVNKTLTTFPFLLPNLFGSATTCLCVVLIQLFLEETLPPNRLEELTLFGVFVGGGKRKKSAAAVAYISLDKSSDIEMSATSSDDDGEGESENENEEDKTIGDATIRGIWASSETRICLILYWLFSFAIVSSDEMIPLFGLADNSGGLKLLPKSIGTFMSASGVFFICLNYPLYTYTVAKVGRRRCLINATLMFAPLTLLVPVSMFIDQGEVEEHTISWSVFLYLTFVVGCARLCASQYFSCISLMLNQSVQNPNHRGSMNGLSSLGDSFMKALAPVFAGRTFAGCVTSSLWTPRVGALVAFGCMSGLSLVVSMVSTRAKIDRLK